MGLCRARRAARRHDGKAKDALARPRRYASQRDLDVQQHDGPLRPAATIILSIPIPQEDYYRLQAVFAGVDRGERDYGESAQQEGSADDSVAKDGDAVGTQADTEEPDASSTKQEPERNKVYAILSHEPRADSRPGARRSVPSRRADRARRG